jgi:hypothetical protein
MNPVCKGKSWILPSIPPALLMLFLLNKGVQGFVAGCVVEHVLQGVALGSDMPGSDARPVRWLIICGWLLVWEWLRLPMMVKYFRANGHYLAGQSGAGFGVHGLYPKACNRLMYFLESRDTTLPSDPST